MTGILYGVGVGPGDPDLLTLRACKILQQVDVVLTAASPRNEYSTAFDIAQPHLKENARIVRLNFPMTRDKQLLQAAWDENARATLAELRAGHHAAFLTLGDPLIYSTFGYLLRTLRALDAAVQVEIASGITSFQAAAARSCTVLCEGEENMLLISGINHQEKLCASLDIADNAVILKAYKNFPEIRASLAAHNMEQNTLMASRLYMENEQITRRLDDAPSPPPYFTLLLSKKTGALSPCNAPESNTHCKKNL